MAREYVSEREYRILHNRYDEKGQVVGQFYRYYKDNSTETHIFIHPEILLMGTEGAGKGTSTGNFANCEKTVVLECEELGFVGDACPEIKSYTMEHDGDYAKLVFVLKEGADIVIETFDDGKTVELA